MIKQHGFLNLTKIPKNLIVTNKKGEKGIWIDVLANKNGQDQYGNTHTVTLYDKDAKQTHYLANLKTQEFGHNVVGNDPSVNYPVNQVVQGNDDNDLPF